MAYDSSAPYGVPRRGYAPTPQSHPPNGYHDPYQEQQYVENYGQQQSNVQKYDQSYEQYEPYEQNRVQYGYETNGRQARSLQYGAPQQYPRQMQRPAYEDSGYAQAYADLQQQDWSQQNGYQQQQRPPRDERQYDPRFQQRPVQSGRQRPMDQQPRGPHSQQQSQTYDRGMAQPQQQPQVYERPGPAQQQQQQQQQPQYDRARATQPQAQPKQYDQPDVRSRPDPRNARQYPQDAQEAQAARRQKQALEKQRANDIAPVSTARTTTTTAYPEPRSAPPQPVRQDPHKMTMEEWKAKERARMHAEALQPEILAQDNAFPVFPTYEKQKGDRSAASSAMGSRDGEAARPSTSASRHAESRPSFTRDHSNSDARPATAHGAPPHRPSLDHKPHSFDPTDVKPTQQPSARMQAEPTQANQQAHSSAQTRPSRDRQQNWPVQEHRQTPPSAQSEPRQQTTRNFAMPPIDTTAAQQRSAYMDHHPLSPVTVPNRPSTAQASRSPLGQKVTTPSSAFAPPGPPQPWTQQHQPRSESLSHIYDGYVDARVPAPVTAPPRTRDEEIEADMPDFDSAAPGGTSLLDKRNRQDLKVAPSELASSASSMISTAQSNYMQPAPSSAGLSHDFEFGFSGDGRTPQPLDMYHGYQAAEPQRAYIPHAPPVQPPFAQQHIPRRSMDDARSMPYRQGPPMGPSPGARPSPSGQLPRSAYPSRIRPDLDRNQTAFTVQSDPGQRRAGSTPPQRQGLRGPPVNRQGEMGVPLTQQRSAPDAVDPQPRPQTKPDALPPHPTPVRPGLVDGGPARAAARPPPVRNYNNISPPTKQSHQRQPSIDQSSRPVTAAELDELRAAVHNNPNNPKQALHLAKKLVEASNVLASEGGRLDARSTTKNREKYIMDAHKIIKRLMATGYPDAQFYMADCYSTGSLGLEPDAKEAFNLYQAAAKGGHPEAAFRTAMCCELGPEEGGTRKDYPKAVQWYRRAAALGDAAGMYKLGAILLKGLLGQPRNVGEAVTWLKRAVQGADEAHPHALFELATLYESTNTNPEVRNKVVADDAYAREMFQRAAQWGYKQAQFRLGQAYEYGTLGLPIDNRASIAWYTKAAAQGDHLAELALSGWYLTGAEGILEHSDTEAYLWARKAASSEPPLAKAMFAMGYFTETGIGCPASLDEAKRWYSRAASYRFPKAQERLEELRKNGGKGARPPGATNGKLLRNDQKRDEAECTIM